MYVDTADNTTIYTACPKKGETEMNRATEEHKMWLFDLEHGNLHLQDEKILQGFVKFYILNGFTIGNVQDDIRFKTNYGIEGVRTALTDLIRALKSFAGEEQE